MYRKEHWNRITLRTGTASTGGLCSRTVTSWGRVVGVWYCNWLCRWLTANCLKIQFTHLPVVGDFAVILATFSAASSCPMPRTTCSPFVPLCCLSCAVVFWNKWKMATNCYNVAGAETETEMPSLGQTQARAASICVARAAQLSWGCRWWCADLRIRNRRIPILSRIRIRILISLASVAWQVAGSRQRVCFVCKELLRNLIYLHVAVVVIVLLLPLVLLVAFPCLLSANEMRLLPSAAAWTRPQLNELHSAGFDVARFLLHFKRFFSLHLVFFGAFLCLLLLLLLLLLFLLFFFFCFDANFADHKVLTSCSFNDLTSTLRFWTSSSLTSNWPREREGEKKRAKGKEGSGTMLATAAN